MPLREPVTRSRASAMPIGRERLGTLHALLEEVEQPVPAVVGMLELRVGRPVVEPPELVALVVRRRVQGLAAAETGDLRLDPAVDLAVGPALGARTGRPEAEV